MTEHTEAPTRLDREQETLACVDKSLDNVGGLPADLTWTNAEVISTLEDIRSLILTGHLSPGTFEATRTGTATQGSDPLAAVDLTDAEKALTEATQWPSSEESATADALIVHGARLAAEMQARNEVLMRQAFTFDRQSPARRPAMRAYLDSVTSMIAEAQVVLALVQMQKTSPEQADAIARMLWTLTEDGGALPELMWEALDARTIDADAVWALAEKTASVYMRGGTS